MSNTKNRENDKDNGQVSLQTICGLKTTNHTTTGVTMATNLKLFLSSQPPPPPPPHSYHHHHNHTVTTLLSHQHLPIPVSNTTTYTLQAFRSSNNNYSRNRRRRYRVCYNALDVQSKDVSDFEATAIAGRDRLLKVYLFA